MKNFQGYGGFCFVGDPHVWSKNPGTRIDKNYKNVCLDKINQAVNIALEKNLYLIFLGDLFHSDKENDIDLITKLTRILKRLRHPPLTVEGNHEKSQTRISDDVALCLMKEAETIYVAEKSGIWGVFNICGESILIGSTPYGETIPQEVKKPDKLNGSFVFWLTHHDLDFGDTYPGVVPIHEIKNVNILINGHIHKTKPQRKVGNMLAFNPGNIMRLSKDCREHIPSVWLWTPEFKDDLVQHTLTYEKNVFKEDVQEVQLSDSDLLLGDTISEYQTSRFVQEMEKSTLLTDHNKTDDGAYIKASIISLCKALEVGNEFTNNLLEIAQEVIEEE